MRHYRRTFQLLPSTAFRLLCCVSVVLSDGPPDYLAGWIGTYTGDCSLQAKQTPQDGVQCLPANDFLRAPYVMTVAWDNNKLLLLKNVSWPADLKGQLTTLPQDNYIHNATLVNQTITFDQRGVHPLCVHLEATFPPQNIGILVYNDTPTTTACIEEGVYMVNNFAAGIITPAWYCPTSMNSVDLQLVCNSTSYSYSCKGTAPRAQRASPPPPPPIPPPSPPPFPPPPQPTPPHPLAHPAPPTPPSPSPSPNVSVLGQPVLQPSPSPSDSHKTTVLAAAVGGAAGFILIAAGIAFIMHKKGWSCHTTNPSSSKEGTDATLAKDAVLFPDTLPGPIQGLVAGDPFLRTTAPQYSWTLDAAGNSPYVQDGITDTYLDSMAIEGQPGPCVQLTSAQVRQEIELLTSGLLGRGGAALVFKCRWRKRFGDALLAIKLLKDAFDTPLTVLQSFEYEGRLLSAIRHPHVVKLYGWCMDLPHVCLIMELLPGSLEGLLYRPALGSSKQATATSSQPAHDTSATNGASSDAAATRSSNNSSMSAHGVRNGISMPHPAPVVPTLQGPLVTASTNESRDATSRGVSHSSGQTATNAITPPTSAPVSIASQSSRTASTPQKLSMQAVLQVAADVAAALAYLHDRQVTGVTEWATEASSAWDAPEGGARAAKVVHRDLKPANVLINSNGRAKLTDFGLARENSSTTIHTMHVNAGTLAYMAPELLAMSAMKPTNRVDIYSLGIMMWELVEHRKPWQDINQAQLVSAVVSGKRPPIQESSMFSASTSIRNLPSDATGDQQGAACPSVKLSMDHNGWSQVPAHFAACPDLVDLIRDCWHQREYKRPSAADVLRRLQAIMGPTAADQTVKTLKAW